MKSVHGGCHSLCWEFGFDPEIGLNPRTSGVCFTDHISFKVTVKEVLNIDF